MEVINPYIAGSPVKNGEMFFGRDDIFSFVKEALRGQHRDNVIVLQGQRRTGKTSILYQMQRHLGEKYICIFIDLHGLALNGIQSMLSDLENLIRRELRNNYSIDISRLSKDENIQDARQVFVNHFLPQVWEAIGDRHILLMLDEAIRLLEQVEAGKLETEIFNYLRHLMEHFDRLNFLFSLGSGLEEMEKEYTFLFSVGMYKKISFLNREAGEALISQPVRDYYQIDPEAVSYILELTSGHPYFIQLICHSLFTSWQHNPKDTLGVEDVDTIIEEVVERGFAVLKYNWEESTDGEKAFLAGLAPLTNHDSAPITIGNIKRAWKALGVFIPTQELNKAAKMLVDREIITGPKDFRFTITLQRIWIEKNAHQEWVSTEIEQSIQQWWKDLPLINRISDRIPNYFKIGIVLLFIIIVGIGLFVINNGIVITTRAKLAATLQAAELRFDLTQTAIETNRLVSIPTAEAAQTMVAFTRTPVSNLQTSTSESLTEIPSFSSTPTVTESNLQLVDGSTRRSELDGMTMVYISAGSFLMGPSLTDPNIDVDEMPQNEVFLDAFWIDQNEVTNVQYEICVNAGVCTSPASSVSYSGRKYFANPEYDNYPVLFVSWYDAATYCNWVGRRLPSEAEWEKAARGAFPSDRIYPWGNPTPTCIHANFFGCSKDTEPVGSFPAGASPYGVLDLIGNAWEWVNDWYKSNYYQDSPETNPLGPDQGEYKVLRGGGWLSKEPNSLRVSARYYKAPNIREWSDIGFRCALSAKVLMMYDNDEVWVINKSPGNILSLSGVTFKRLSEQGDVTAEFTSELWNAVASEKVSALPHGGCLGVFVDSYTYNQPDECGSIYGYIQVSNNSGRERQFWMPIDGSTKFQVFQNDQLITTCEITEGSCEFELLPRP